MELIAREIIVRSASLSTPGSTADGTLLPFWLNVLMMDSLSIRSSIFDQELRIVAARMEASMRLCRSFEMMRPLREKARSASIDDASKKR